MVLEVPILLALTPQAQVVRPVMPNNAVLTNHAVPSLQVAPSLIPNPLGSATLAVKAVPVVPSALQSAVAVKAGASFDGARLLAASTPDSVPVPLRPERRGLAKAAKLMAPILAVTAATAVLDIGVVEGILHPLNRQGVPWDTFQTTIGGYTLLKWWLYFIPVSTFLLALTGWLLARWRGSVAAMLTFLMGVEDLLYYWLRGTGPSDGLGWLDDNPFIAWTRVLTRTPSVTKEGVYIAAAAGLAAGLALLARGRVRRPAEARSRS